MKRRIGQTPTSEILKHWQMTLGPYVKRKRKEAEKGQKELRGISRQTLSLIERGQTNIELKTLIEVLNAVDGDLSEAFQASPRTSANPHHQMIHDLLQDILEFASPDVQSWIIGNIRTFHKAHVSSRK